MGNSNAIIVDFPLRGEWVAPNTPGDKVPSHGTEIFGQKYAYDFIRTEKDSKSKFKFYKANPLRYWTIGVPMHDCYCYREPIYSPVDGEVVVVRDGVKEPRYLHPVYEIIKGYLRPLAASIKAKKQGKEKLDLHKFIGNYIIIRFDEYYAFFAHISPGTIKVKEGQLVSRGDILGEVGHTGNSTAPHLHFHIMDSTDLFKAKGIACVFKTYYLEKDNGWEEVQEGILKSDQRIRL